MEEQEPKFVGSFFRSLDAKGRLLLPPSYLHAMNNGPENKGSLWFTSFYGRIVAYLPDDWQETVRQLCSIPFPSPALANFKTKVLGLAEELIPDAQGRIRISRPLMREAALEKDIVVVGMLNKFEIWARARFEALQDEDVSSELKSLGLALQL